MPSSKVYGFCKNKTKQNKKKNKQKKPRNHTHPNFILGHPDSLGPGSSEYSENCIQLQDV